MAENWEPGDLAMLMLDGQPHGVARRAGGGWRCLLDNYFHDDLLSSLTAQPVVVVPYENREQVERLVRLGFPHALFPAAADDMQRALREFAKPKPPRPEEPTGLGAVVEDADGKRWTNTHGALAWQPQDGRARRYADIAVVRVLSEGVQP